jgi:hypothetical protein
MGLKTLTILLLFIGTIILQIFLSRIESKWLGYILPGMYLVLAFIVSTGFMIYDGNIMSIIYGFLVLSIPSMILFVLYEIVSLTTWRKKGREMK